MKIVVSLIFTGITLGLAAQDVILQGQTRREIEKAQRIETKPVITDTVIQQKVTEYPLLSMQFKTSTEVDRIEPATIKIKEQLDQLYSTYVKLGVGSELMPIGEIYFNNTRSRKYIYGASVKHLSSWGNIPGYLRNTFDRTAVNAFGGINETRYSLIGNVNYRNQGLHYYALPGPIDSLSRDSIRQRYNDVGFDVMYKSNTKIDTMGIDYFVGFKYNHFNTMRPKVDSLDTWRSRENYIAVTGGGEYKLNENVYAVGIDILHNRYKYGNEYDSLSPIDTAMFQNNTIVNLKPRFKTFLWDNRFKATVGLDLTVNSDHKTRVHIFPQLEVKYSLFNDIFIPYVGVRGGVHQNTLKSLTLVNEFVRPNMELRNENTPLDVYGGFKGTLSKTISFNIGVNYAMVRDMALFVNDTMFSSGNRYTVKYDSLKMFTLEGSISYQKLEKMKVDILARYRSYELRTEAFAWHKPNFELHARLFYNLFDKFYLNLDARVETGRKALAYGPGEGVLEQDAQYFRKLGAIYDFNLGLEYRYTKRLSVFIQANNFAAQRYQRWYNAPVHRFQVLGGLTFRL